MDSEHGGNAGSRGAPRSHITAFVETRDGMRRTKATATDISVTGLRVRSTDPLRVGQELWIKLPTIEARKVTVQWTDRLTAGCLFAEPLAEYVLEHLLKNGDTGLRA